MLVTGAEMECEPLLRKYTLKVSGLMISFQEPLITATTVALVCWHIKNAVIFPASYRKCI